MKRVGWGDAVTAACFVILVGFLVLAVIGCVTYRYPEPDAQLPSDGELIYANMGGGRPVRVIRVGECYITQAVPEMGREWLVLDRGGFLGSEASVDCAGEPELPS